MKSTSKNYYGRGAGRALLAAVLFASAFGAAAPELSAQQSISSATLSGRVEDANRDVVGGAAVAVKDVEKNLRWETVSDAEGRFRFSYLPAGAYLLTVEQSGFAGVSRALTLTIGQALDLPIELAVTGLAEKVLVTADAAPAIETVRTQVSETIRSREVEGLPLNGRNYLDLALLVPAVSRTNTGSNQRFAETSAVPGTGISVAGQRNLNNSFVVDGLSANDDAAGLAGTFYGQEVIREFQVVTSGGIAEFGRASAGVVNVVTQSGTNDWRGRAYVFLRNQRFDARNPLAPRKDPLTQAQYGASVGGPVRRDATFLFANFEQTRRNDATVITITPANVAAINARLDQLGYRGARLETGLVPGGYDVTNFFARADHRLNNSNLLAARYNIYDIASVNARTVGGLNAVSRGTGLGNRDQTVAASNVATLSPRTINETRAQFTRSRLAAPANDAAGPAVNISGVASFGTATFSPTARALDVYEVVNALTTRRGAHSVKGGADFLLNRVQIIFPGALQGVYTFSSLANFQAGRYITVQQAFGEPAQFQSNPNLGLFVQDEWRLGRRLTINAGLRYDAQFIADPVGTDRNNFAPRVGVAYATGDHKTVVRAGYGIYFDRLPLRAVSNALQRNGTTYKVAVVSFGQGGAPVFPNILAGFPDGLLTSITTIDPRIENSYGQQVSLQVERELPGDASLSAGYLYLRGLHLILSRNVNVPTVPASAGVFNLGRPDPRFGNVGRFESSGESSYSGLIVSLNKRAARLFSVRLSYTLSKTIDNAGNFFFSSPQNNFDLRDERGLSDNDQRHRLTFSGSLDAPAAGIDQSAWRRALENFRLSYIFSYGSRPPFNVLTGTDRNNDTNVNDRPAGLGRNTGRGFDFGSLDLRVSRRFGLTERVGLEVIAEGFNVFNRANLQLPNNTFGAGTNPLPSFGRPNAAGDARQIQFGLRASF